MPEGPEVETERLTEAIQEKEKERSLLMGIAGTVLFVIALL